jgi:hypothetical protein
MLGILCPSDPAVLLIVILESVSYGLIGCDVRELFIVQLGVQLIFVLVEKGGHADSIIWRVVSPKATVE